MTEQPILAFDQVAKRFGGLTVVDDLSFSIRRNSRTALIGPNGAGKTTVFNLISGVYPLTAGRIRFAGQDLDGVPSNQRVRLGIARNFQNIRLMPHLSAVENVMIGQHSRGSGLANVLQPVSLLPGNRWRAAAREALAAAGLDRYERSLVGGLPYGVQKRIELVRALQADPQLLLLDEPAAGLNLTEKDELRDLLDGILADGRRSLFVVEHDMQFVGALCDRVIVLNFGCKIAEGTPDEVRADPLVQEAYLGGSEDLAQETADAS